MTNTTEQAVVWKQYPKYPFIEANQFGEIRTVDRYVTRKDGSKRLIKGHVLKQHPNKKGYLQVGVRVNGKKVTLRVHRIIASCFLPNPDNLPQVNHKDCDKTNNNVSNLEWCTNEYNIAYKEKYGKSAAEVLGRSVLAVNLKNREVSFFKTQSEAARQLKVNVGNINHIVRKRGRLKTTGGFWFCNADSNAVEKTRVKFGNDVADKVEKLMNENCD